MTSFDPPKDPEKNQRWYDETGEVWIWDGNDWIPLDDPFFSPTSTIREE
jgi:hypothetical protein